MINLLELTKVRFKTLTFHTFRIVFYSISFAIILALNFLGFAFINSKGAVGNINIMILVNAFVIAFLMIFLTTSLYRGELSSNQINLELRSGYSKKDIFLSRLIEIIIELALIMVVMIVANLIVIGAAGKMHSIVWYHMLVTSLGWYILAFVMSTSLGIFFASLTPSAAAGTLTAVITFALIIIGSLGRMFYANTDGKSADDNAKTMLKNAIESRTLNFAMNDLGITGKDQWDKEVEDKFINIKTSSGSSSNQIDTSNFKDAGQSWWQNYYGNVSGGGNSGDGSNDVFASFATFGINLFKDNDTAKNLLPKKIYDFLSTVDSYFRQSDAPKYSYSDIENWNLLAGYAGNAWNYQGSTYSTEDFTTILKDMSNSNKFKNYSIIKDLINYSDASVISSAAGDYGDNYGNLYPVYVQGGWSTGNGFTDVDSSQQQVESLNVPPAEMIFNRNIMYFISESFDDMQEPTFGSPIPASVEYAQVAGTHEFSLYVRNAYYGNDDRDSTTLPYGDFSKEMLDKFQIYDFTTNTQLKLKSAKYSDDNNIYMVFDDSVNIYDKIVVGYTGSELDLNHVNASSNGLSFLANIQAYKLSNFDPNKSSNDGEEFKNNLAIELDLPKVASGMSSNRPWTNEIVDYLNAPSDNGTINANKFFNLKIDNSNVKIQEVAYGYEDDLYFVTDQKTDSAEVKLKDINLSSTESGQYLINTSKADEAKNNIFPGVVSNIVTKNDTLSLFIRDDDASVLKADNNTTSLLNKFKITDSKNNLITLSDPTIDADNNQILDFKMSNVPDGKISVNYDGPEFNLDLINQDMFASDYQYNDSETHKTAISLIYNPVVQINEMFNGVNYSNPVMDNIINSETDPTENVGSAYLTINPYTAYSSQNPYTKINSSKRVAYVEPVYIEYIVINCLWVFASYWIYKKMITE